MMEYPLLVHRFLERTSVFSPDKEIVTREGDGVHRYTYADLMVRSSRLSNALAGLGVGVGDRVGTFGWNTYRHLEVYFAAPAMGAVLHTINIRLFTEDLVYIINHAGDKVILVDPDLVPLLEPLASQMEMVKHFIIMTDDRGFTTTLSNALIYEDLLSAASDAYSPVNLDENAPAGLCYTSATTGRPKGVIYSHRGIVLHSMMEAQADTIGFRERDVVLPVVPMFHANCWGVPYSSAMVGANLVLTGVRPGPEVICQLFESEKVTLSLGVPTIWVGLLDYLERSGKTYDFSSLREIASGGSAVPISLIQAYKEKLGVKMVQAYGMTEATPVISYNRLNSHLDDMTEGDKMRLAGTQGVMVPGLEMRLVDDEGNDLPWDGEQRGELLFKGPWIASEYYNDPRSSETFIDGWYHSGDIASVNADGYIQIGDRVKDMVKSGGEWISSVDLETAIIAHPGVLEAAVIAIPHERWVERPLACVVPNADSQGKLGKADVLDFIRDRFAPWWLPDDVVFIDEIPKTSVGKFDKKVLRERYKDHHPES
ncbi:MAG: long-chain fatty acid--CoA ligase [Chloroflexi bacterium]|nr:long-chain fatty acid--CoA ligase [Chloroflexota bacterium]MDA1271162.1 long-chain fatty acid--CoA ligase [Chloroflexota bacterium]PKB58690.1 MAG: fatty-acid--CoA ligase [SAR202 cluster bacterium Casp-Chloro-G2]